MKWAALWKLELSKLHLLRISMRCPIASPSSSFLEGKLFPTAHSSSTLSFMPWRAPGVVTQTALSEQYITVRLCPPLPPWGTHLILFHPGPEFQKLVGLPLLTFQMSPCTALVWNLWTVTGVERGRNASKIRQVGIWSMRLEISSSVRRTG